MKGIKRIMTSCRALLITTTSLATKILKFWTDFKGKYQLEWSQARGPGMRLSVHSRRYILAHLDDDDDVLTKVNRIESDLGSTLLN